MKMRIHKFALTILGACIITVSHAQEIPDFINPEDLKDVDCKCLEKEVKYTKEEQKYIDILWEESLKYLAAYAKALTTSPEDSPCINSDEATLKPWMGLKKCV
jgi:hypothetical protein